MERPPHAILLWSDDKNVYAELPMTGEGYHTITFPLSTGGLARALDLLKDHTPKPAPARDLSTHRPRAIKGFTLGQTNLALSLIGKVKK